MLSHQDKFIRITINSSLVKLYAIQSILRLYSCFWLNFFDYKGFVSRLEYWKITFINIVCTCCSMFLIGFLEYELLNNLCNMYFLAIIIGSISMHFRRMNDIGNDFKVSIILLLIIPIPYIGLLAFLYLSYLACQPTASFDKYPILEYLKR